MIRLEGLVREFRLGTETVHALSGVDLAIDAGEFVAVMGPSGSGKSTMLHILGCLDVPTAGRYLLDGKEVSSLSEGELAAVRRHQIGFVFQSFHLIPRLSARGNVEVPMIFDGIEPRERKRRAEAALGKVGLAHRLDHRPSELSGGERQRVAIARAVVMEPKILLADEPTGNLDSRSGKGILDRIETMNADGLTVILVTHDPGVAERARRILRLADGRVVSDEPVGAPSHAVS